MMSAVGHLCYETVSQISTDRIFRLPSNVKTDYNEHPMNSHIKWFFYKGERERNLNFFLPFFPSQYLGDRVSEKVKAKVIELLYSWTVALPEESKIKDAYYMLKRQGGKQHS